jgi:hypothetical protein
MKMLILVMISLHRARHRAVNEIAFVSTFSGENVGGDQLRDFAADKIPHWMQL